MENEAEDSGRMNVNGVRRVKKGEEGEEELRGKSSRD